MPTYEYRCENCRKKFTLTQTMTEHGTKKAKCPKCGSRKVTQLVSTFYAQTASKS